MKAGFARQSCGTSDCIGFTPIAVTQAEVHQLRPYRRLIMVTQILFMAPLTFKKRRAAVAVKHLDGPIRANRLADSRESPDSRESFPGFPN